jgi:hypothetical protein
LVHPGHVLPLGGHYADDGHGRVVDPDFLADRALATKQLVGNRMAENHHFGRLHHFVAIKGATQTHGPIANQEIVLV